MIIKKRNIVRGGQDQVLRKGAELVHLRAAAPTAVSGLAESGERGRPALSCGVPATRVCLFGSKSPEYGRRSETVDATSPHRGTRTGPTSSSTASAETQTALSAGSSFAPVALSLRTRPTREITCKEPR